MATLHFKGKSAVWNHHLSVPYQTLDPVAKMSHKGKDDEENLIIEGDNLIALKALLPKYQGKIKCIYIDPPYNTGNEGWVYSDNVSNPIIKSWIGETVGKEGEDLTRHDKWLCMMTPRMKLLRELLADDGVIFVSIDEKEIHHLKILMIDIFGDKNFVDQIIIQSNPRGSQASKHFAVTHEYLLVFAKNEELLTLGGKTKENENEYSSYDKELGPYRLLGLRQRGGAWKRSDRPNMFYPIYVNPKNGEVSLEKTKEHSIEVIPIRPSSNEEGRWTWSSDKVRAENHLLIGKEINRNGENESWDIFRKDYLLDNDGTQKTSKMKTIWDEKTMNYQAGRKSLKDLFDGKDLFDYPKPVDLVKKVITAGAESDSLILDSFAGSGTTAQAVLELNKEDGGNRKFILVQIPEETGKDSAAYKAGYKTVQEITQARVKKVIERDGLDTGFTYYKLGQQIDADGILSGELPSYDDFAKYVYYLATGKNYPAKSKVDEKKYFVGKDENTAVFLVYENDFEELKSMALTLELAKDLHKQHDGRKIVYAPACFLDEYHLDQFNITFVGIPFNLFERN